MTDRRIGVYICYCGGNISDYVEVEKVRDAINNDRGVVVAKTTMFACSDAAQEEMIEDIKTNELDGLVVASCSPKLHLFTFRAMAERAGLNPYQYVQVNLREQDSWAHQHDKDHDSQMRPDGTSFNHENQDNAKGSYYRRRCGGITRRTIFIRHGAFRFCHRKRGGSRRLDRKIRQYVSQ